MTDAELRNALKAVITFVGEVVFVLTEFAPHRIIIQEKYLKAIEKIDEYKTEETEDKKGGKK